MPSFPDILPIPIKSGRGKQPLVVQSLMQLAQKLGPGTKLPTARELAQALGVTGATLGRGLAQLEGRGVLRCRQGSGIYVETGVLQKRISLVFGENIFTSASSRFGSLLLKHCAKRAADQGERFSFFVDIPTLHGVMDGRSVPAHQDLVDNLKEGKVDGILIVARSSEAQEEWLRAQEIPVIRAGSRRGSLASSMDTVALDFEKLVNVGVRRLADAGCRSVGLLGALQEHGDFFRQAAAAHGLTICPRWVWTPPTEEAYPSEVHEQMGRTAAEWLMAQSGWPGNHAEALGLPQGILIADDTMARGALPALAAGGVAIGDRLQVASHVNRGSSDLAQWESRIIPVEFDLEMLARELFSALEARMGGKPPVPPIFVPPLSEETESRPAPVGAGQR